MFPRLPPLALSTLLAASVLTCCRETVETSVNVQRTAASCTATVDGSPHRMNTYVIDVFASLGTQADAAPLERQRACGTCSMQGSCARQPERRRCVCGSDRDPGAGALSAALSGIRLTDLDTTGAYYCIRVAAFELPGAYHTAAAGECDCQQAIQQLPDRAARGYSTPVRACAINIAPARIEPGGRLDLDLVCLDDGGLSGVRPQVLLGECLDDFSYLTMTAPAPLP